MAEWMCLADSPRPLGPGPIGPCTLVAMTASSRERYLRSSLPVICSLVPSE